MKSWEIQHILTIQSYLDRDFREIVRITQSCSDVQSEITAVFYDRLTKLDVI